MAVVKLSRSEICDLAAAVRQDILDMTYAAGANGGHIGGALSSADIFAVLYGCVLNVSPKNPLDPGRDRFFLSKGHISLAHYAVLAECGFISHDDLATFEKQGSCFQTHADAQPEKGIEISNGSLGYGLSIGVGSALAAKQKGLAYKTYVLIGDGECNEGTIWEAAMAAVRFKLDNLIAIVDVNGQQLDGFTSDIMPIRDIAASFRELGFAVTEIDGHSVEQLFCALSASSEGQPLAIVAYTVKGKGIPSIEGKTGWHHARITKEQYMCFKEELSSCR